MTSEPGEAYVWLWLPGATEPVVAGRLAPAGGAIDFNYGRSYLARADAIPLYLPELPLEPGRIPPPPGLSIAGCIDDGAPDAWGQRVIVNHILGNRDGDTDPAELGRLTYLLASGSNRVGALDFQAAAHEYVARDTGTAPLEELLQAAERVEEGVPLDPELDRALMHGSSAGGARPKVLLEDGGRSLIAKFPSTTDRYPLVKYEFVAMELARRAGLDVAPVEIVEAGGRNVLLVSRFDRPAPGRRRALVSALTMLGLDEMMGRYASYADLAEIVRARFTDAPETLRELFARIVFNVLVGNTDDHARNHAAFWDGRDLTLTPAFDVCAIPRGGGEASQAMAIGPEGFRSSEVAGCVAVASTYQLSEPEAREIVDRQIEVIEAEWDDVCDLAGMGEVDRRTLWRRAVLNPAALVGY